MGKILYIISLLLPPVTTGCSGHMAETGDAGVGVPEKLDQSRR